MMRLSGFGLALLLFPLSVGAEEPIRLATKEISVPRPAKSNVTGPLPRPVLFLQVAERGQTTDEPSATSFYVYDPASPEAGLRKVFHGPGQDQYCRFITPLLDGCGIAVGELDPQHKPKGPRAMFWFNLLSGEIGKTIAQETWRESMVGSEITFLAGSLAGSDENKWLHYVNRYDFLKNKLTHYRLGFTHPHPLGEQGLLVLENDERIVRMDLVKNECEPLGELPAGGLPHSIDEAEGIYPAGPKCSDGVYCIRDFSLLFRPKGEKWRTVIERVHIFKTFGGRAPHLPVAYVGQGRFAVARTTKDEADLPADKKKGFFGDPGLAATMLIDGRTGNVLKETAPRPYDHNPSLEIPDDWWSADVKPASQKPGLQETKSCFQWNSVDKMVRYAGNGKMPLGKDDVVRQSGDGRYLVVHRPNHQSKKLPHKLVIQIVDGKTGDIVEHAITSNSYEIYVLVTAWQLLCSATPDAETLKAFRSSGLDLFREPMGNW